MSTRRARSEIDASARQRLRDLAAWAPVIALIVLLAWTGLRGVDFGYHWDE